MLNGTATSAFIDGAPGSVLADGSTVNLSQVLAYELPKIVPLADYIEVTNERLWREQPRWQLFAYGPLDDMIPPPPSTLRFSRRDGRRRPIGKRRGSAQGRLVATNPGSGSCAACRGVWTTRRV